MLLKSKKFYSLAQLAGKAGTGGGAYTPQGVRFDGSTTAFTRGSTGLIGAADSVRGTMAFWFLMQNPANDTSAQYFCFASSGGTFIFPNRTASGDINIRFRDAGGLDSIFLDTLPTNYTAAAMAGTWAHLIASWDGSIPRRQLYVNGVDVMSVGGSTSTNVASKYTATDWAIGSRPGTSVSQVDMAEFYFNQTVAIDLSVPANVQKFRDASGNAVDLGATGAGPTGAQPILCFTGGVSGWATNKGSGGNFAVAGTFANSPTSPP